MPWQKTALRYSTPHICIVETLVTWYKFSHSTITESVYTCTMYSTYGYIKNVVLLLILYTRVETYGRYVCTGIIFFFQILKIFMIWPVRIKVQDKVKNFQKAIKYKKYLE